MYLKRSLLPLLIFLSVISFAQTRLDYLVTTKKDSLNGKVKIMSFDNDQAQITVDGKRHVYQAYQIKILRMGEFLYAPQKRLDKIRIMKVLKSGYLSLYAYQESNQSAFEGRFLSKRDGTSIDLPNISFKKLLSKFLDDCPEVSDNIKAGQLLRKDIETIVDLYNECVDAGTKRRLKEAISPQKLTAIQALRKKLETLPDFENKKNAQDLIVDMEDKIKKGTPVPPYLLESLKTFLGNKEEVKDELTSVILALMDN